MFDFTIIGSYHWLPASCMHFVLVLQYNYYVGMCTQTSKVDLADWACKIHTWVLPYRVPGNAIKSKNSSWLAEIQITLSFWYDMIDFSSVVFIGICKYGGASICMQECLQSESNVWELRCSKITPSLYFK